MENGAGKFVLVDPHIADRSIHHFMQEYLSFYTGDDKQGQRMLKKCLSSPQSPILMHRYCPNWILAAVFSRWCSTGAVPSVLKRHSSIYISGTHDECMTLMLHFYRPQALNSLDTEMVEHMVQLLGSCVLMNAPSCIVIKGAGDKVCLETKD
jgi:hypothetical protein